MAGEACINDTNSVDLSFNGSSELEAAVRLRTIANGALTETVDGVGATVSPSGGIIHSASGLAAKSTNQGIHIGAEGIMKINGYSSTTSPGSSPNAVITRGVNVQYGNTLFLAGSLPSNELGSYVIAHARWRGLWSTSFSGFGGQLQDRVDAYLQLSVDFGAFFNVDFDSLTRTDMGGMFHLDAWYPLIMANGTAHSLQARLLVGGGTVTGTSSQGLIETEFGGTLEWIY